MTGDAVPELSPALADLARRIHHGRLPVVPLADVVFRMQRAGHPVTRDQVHQALTSQGPP